MLPVDHEAEALQRKEGRHLHGQLHERAGQRAEHKRADAEAMEAHHDERDREHVGEHALQRGRSEAMIGVENRREDAAEAGR